MSTAIKRGAAAPARRASARVSLRINPKIKMILMQAAKSQHVALTDFMVQASQAAAENALAERTRFALSAPQWRQFNAALDSPPREIPALRKLFKEPSFFKSA